MFYETFKQLYDTPFVRIGDTFVAADTTHTIADNHIHTPTSNVVALQRYIGSNYHDVLERVYGYTPQIGMWPSFRQNDMVAARNSALMLLAYVDGVVGQPVKIGDVVFPCMYKSIYNVQKDGRGSLVYGMVYNLDSRGAYVNFANGQSLYMLYVDLINISPNKTQTQDEYLQKSSISDQGETGSAGTGVQSGGGPAAIGCRPTGNAQRIEDSNAVIGKGKVCGSVLKW